MVSIFWQLGTLDADDDASPTQNENPSVVEGWFVLPFVAVVNFLLLPFHPYSSLIVSLLLPSVFFLSPLSLTSSRGRREVGKMSDQEDLDYYIMFPSFPPSPKDPTLTTGNQDQREEFVFVYKEDKRPVIVLLGWAGCQDKYLAKYSAIYEEKRYQYFLNYPFKLFLIFESHYSFFFIFYCSKIVVKLNNWNLKM